TLPAASQNLAQAHNFSLSNSVKYLPEYFMQLFITGSNDAVSVPSKSIQLWELSQNGGFFVLPHLHSATGFELTSKTFPFAYSILTLSLSEIIISSHNSGLPNTKYGPSPM